MRRALAAWVLVVALAATAEAQEAAGGEAAGAGRGRAEPEPSGAGAASDTAARGQQGPEDAPGVATGRPSGARGGPGTTTEAPSRADARHGTTTEAPSRADARPGTVTATPRRADARHGTTTEAPSGAEARPGDATADSSGADARHGDATADLGGDDATAGDPGTASDDSAAPPGQHVDPLDELPEEHRPRLTLEVDTGDGVMTGDVVHVVVTAEVPEGDDVTVPDQELGSFEIFDHRYHDAPVENGQRRRFRFELDLLALEPGEQELPAIRLRVVTPDGEMGTVTTEPRTIEVGSHIANEPDAQPRPPTAPIPVLEEDYTLLWALGVLGALLLTALLGFFAARWWGRRAKEAKPPPPPRPPWEVALEELAALGREKVGLLADGRQAELVDRVSDVLRNYLGQRYDFNGLESTTDEVITRLRKVKLRGVKLADITALLADSDLVKFAKAMPDEAQCDRMLEGATQIVRATTPRPSARASARPATEGSGARIVTKDGEVVLPISAYTIEEAEREIRAQVGAAFREAASDPSFEGTLRVALSPALAPSENVSDALRRLHARLTSELATMPLSGGRRARIVLEHFHGSLREAAERGEPALRTVIDDEGVRVEQRLSDSPRDPSPPPQAGEGAQTGAASAASSTREALPLAGGRGHALEQTPDRNPTPDPHPSPPPQAGEGAQGGAASSGAREALPLPLAGGGRGEGHALEQTPDRNPTSDHPRAEGAPRGAPRGRTKTGPVDWDRSAVTKETSPLAYAPTESMPAVHTPAPGATSRVDVDRVLPAFAPSGESSGVLLRWITGLERPVQYVAGEEPIGASALGSLGLTRGGVHERALSNLRRAIPPGFAPGADPAVLDDADGAAVLALPELVPAGDAWLAYPIRGEGLVVMREAEPSTKAELARLERARRDDAAPIFERPVRVTRRGFEPVDWPSSGRTTDPGFASPDAAKRSEEEP